MPFRLQSKFFFLTYPQCPIPLSVASELIKSLFGERLEWSIVCQEKHEDGYLHLHAVVVCKTRWDIRNERKLDLKWKDATQKEMVTYHGNYTKCRSLYHSIKYVMKEQNYVGINCDPKMMLKAAVKKTSSQAALIAHQVMIGTSLEEIDQLYPGMVMMHLQKIKDYINWKKSLQLFEQPKKKFLGCHQWDRISNRSWELKIVKWINTNFSVPRKHRQPQLWVHGQTSTGKTHLLMQLNEYFNGYHMPDDGKWNDDYSDSYDFAYFDEFKGCKTIQFMNGFVEGSSYPLPRRGQAPYIKQKNMPVIVCSNYGIQGVFQKADPIVVAALKTRFVEVEVPCTERIELQFEFDESDTDTAPMISSGDDLMEEEAPQLVEPEEGPEERDFDRRNFVDWNLVRDIQSQFQ